MSNRNPIPARAESIPAHDAFEAHTMQGVLWFERGSAVDCPRGLNIDSTIVIDMRADGRVEGIEIMFNFRYKPRMTSREPAHALYLGDLPDNLSAADAALTLEQNRTQLRWLFGPPAQAQRYALGGGAFAEIEAGTLVALGVDLDT